MSTPPISSSAANEIADSNRVSASETLATPRLAKRRAEGPLDALPLKRKRNPATYAGQRRSKAPIFENAFQLSAYHHDGDEARALPESSLSARANAGDKTVKEVMAGQTKTFTVLADQNMSVFTSAMNGCLGLAIVSTQADGKRQVTLSHHPEISFPVMKAEVMKVQKQHKKGSDTVALIIVPARGKGARDAVAMLSSLAREMNSAFLIEIPYDPGANLNTDGSAFILNIPKNGEKKPITYQAFSKPGVVRRE